MASWRPFPTRWWNSPALENRRRQSRPPALFRGNVPDAIGKNLSDLLDDQSTQIGLKTIAEVLETQQVISKISEIQYGGAKRYVDVRMAPYTADTVIAIGARRD